MTRPNPNSAPTPRADGLSAAPHSGGEATYRERAIALLSRQQVELETMIELNRSADVDRVGRFILDGLDRHGRRYLARIRAELRRGPDEGPYGALGRFGPNGYGPAITDIIRSAETQRALAKRGAVRRAA